MIHLGLCRDYRLFRGQAFYIDFPNHHISGPNQQPERLQHNSQPLLQPVHDTQQSNTSHVASFPSLGHPKLVWLTADARCRRQCGESNAFLQFLAAYEMLNTWYILYSTYNVDIMLVHTVRYTAERPVLPTNSRNNKPSESRVAFADSNSVDIVTFG